MLLKVNLTFSLIHNFATPKLYKDGHFFPTRFARNTPESIAQLVIVLGFSITHAIGFVVLTLAVLSDVMSPAGWMGAVLYMVLTLA